MCFETLGSRMYPSHISILRCVSESPGRLSCKRWERRAKTGTPVWHDGLTRRLKSLLRTGPLHALRGSKAAALLPHDDVAALSMKALEILIDALGLRPGSDPRGDRGCASGNRGGDQVALA